MSRGRRSTLQNGFFASSSINEDHPYEEEFNFEAPSHPIQNQANRGGLSAFFSSSSASPPLPPPSSSSANGWGLQTNADSSVTPPNAPANRQTSSPPRSEQNKIRNIALQPSLTTAAAALTPPISSDRKTHENDQQRVVNEGDASSLQDNDKADTEQGGQYIPELFERFAENFNTALTETFKQFEQFSDSTAERHEVVESLYKRAEAEISLLKKRKREAQNAVEKFRMRFAETLRCTEADAENEEVVLYTEKAPSTTMLQYISQNGQGEEID
eukprot:scaffold644_cov168-Ochromonas_danica.AAC.31